MGSGASKASNQQTAAEPGGNAGAQGASGDQEKIAELVARLQAAEARAEQNKTMFEGEKKKREEEQARVVRLEAEVSALKKEKTVDVEEAPVQSQSTHPPPSGTKTSEDALKKLNTDAWEALFNQIDRDHSDKISLEELQEQMKGTSELLLSRSKKLRDLQTKLKTSAADEAGGVKLEEFAEVMHELFNLNYQPFFEALDIGKELTAAAWKHVVGADGCPVLLKEETNYMQAFKSLARMAKPERTKIFVSILQSVTRSLAERMSDAVVEAEEYEMQQQQASEAGMKFGGMVLGDALCFDVGPEVLGLPNLDFERGITEEHKETKTFKAWNNDLERTTSPSLELLKVLPGGKAGTKPGDDEWNGWEGKINNQTYSGEPMPDCEEGFELHRMAKRAGLEKAELVMLRLYTGPMYVKYNGVMRTLGAVVAKKLKGLDKKPAELGPEEVRAAMYEARLEIAEGVEPKDAEGKSPRDRGEEPEEQFTTSITVLISSLLKVRTVCALPQDRKVYRGFAGLATPECLKFADERGNQGGVDFGFLSTSTDRLQAIGYINIGKGMPQMYEMDLGQIDRGADVSWISYFPGEAEVLLPPFSSLEATGNPKFKDVEFNGTMKKVMVWPVRVNVNIQGKTIGEIRETRKRLFTQMATNVMTEVKTVFARKRAAPATMLMPGLGPGLGGMGRAHVGKASADGLDALAQAVLTDCLSVVDKYKQEESRRFNRDKFYSAAVQDVLNLVSWAHFLLVWWQRAGGADRKPDSPFALTKLSVKRFLPSYIELGRGHWEEDLGQAEPAKAKKAAKRNDTTPARGAAWACNPADGKETFFDNIFKIEKDIDEKIHTPTGGTALHKAAGEGNKEAVWLLLEGGADLYALDDEGNTALMEACRAGKSETALVMIESKIGGDLFVDFIKHKDEAALKLAQEKKLDDVVKALGADISRLSEEEEMYGQDAGFADLLAPPHPAAVGGMGMGFFGGGGGGLPTRGPPAPAASAGYAKPPTAGSASLAKPAAGGGSGSNAKPPPSSSEARGPGGFGAARGPGFGGAPGMGVGGRRM